MGQVPPTPPPPHPTGSSPKPFLWEVRSRYGEVLHEEGYVALGKSGAISLVGKVGQVSPPHIVLPLTVEPTKPRLCHDARYLYLSMLEKPFSLDKMTDLPRYVFKDSYQTVLGDKSGYDHLFLSEESRTYFGIQWGDWFFTYNSFPFGWKISHYVYHSTGLMASQPRSQGLSSYRTNPRRR